MKKDLALSKNQPPAVVFHTACLAEQRLTTYLTFDD
jgi:hypothetical protein